MILNGISFEINAGERVGFLGESGCGKSTIFNLIERFYEPNRGDIFIGKKSIHDCNPRFLRERIGWVSQQAYMTKRNIRENLLYGRRYHENQISMKEIEDALELAQCSFFLKDSARFPDGLFSDIGVNGSKLSGGELQRLSLARVLLSDPKPEILLLDEYTSALDEGTQLLIQNTIQDLWLKSNKKITILSIAHRISNFKQVDRIIGISRSGQVAEVGTPQQLLKQHPEGIFATFLKTSVVDFT